MSSVPNNLEWARDNLRTLYLWDTSEKQNILRAAMARGFGLDPMLMARPFPGSPAQQVTIVSQDPSLSPIPAAPVAPAAPIAQASAGPVARVEQAVAAAAPSLLSRVVPWALAAAMGAGGLGYFLHPGATPTAAPAPVAPIAASATPAAAAPAPAVAAPAPIKPVQLQVQWKMGPNGQWQVVTTPVQPGS